MNNIVRYDPTNQLQRFREEVNQLFDDALWRSGFQFTPFNNPVRWPAWSTNPNQVVGDNLSVDMYETDNEVVVKADLPDVQPEDVQVEECDGWLSIRAQTRQETERNQTGWHIQERRYGAWQRTLRLPSEVQGEKAEAEIDNGILTITLPKVNAGKPLLNRIKVKWPKLKLPKLGKQEKKVEVVHG